MVEHIKLPFSSFNLKERVLINHISRLVEGAWVDLRSLSFNFFLVLPYLFIYLLLGAYSSEISFCLLKVGKMVFLFL